MNTGLAAAVELHHSPEVSIHGREAAEALPSGIRDTKASTLTIRPGRWVSRCF